MENENKFNDLIASLQSKIDNIAASVNNIEGERISKKQAEEAAAAQKAKEEHETQLKAAWEEEFKKKYGITAEAPIADNAGSEPTPEPNTPSAEPVKPVGLAPTIKVQENTATYKTVDEIKKISSMLGFTIDAVSFSDDMEDVQPVYPKDDITE